MLGSCSHLKLVCLKAIIMFLTMVMDTPLQAMAKLKENIIPIAIDTVKLSGVKDLNVDGARMVNSL